MASNPEDLPKMVMAMDMDMVIYTITASRKGKNIPGR